METLKIKNWIIFALIVFITVLSTCEFSRPVQIQSETEQDTLFYRQWKREKQEKIIANLQHEKRIYELERENDSLQQLIKTSKVSLKAYRFKVKEFETRLREAITSVDSTDSPALDSLHITLDSLSVAVDASDSACDETVDLLEKVIANKDSCLQDHLHVENNLRDINELQEKENQNLQNRLTESIRAERKISRQNKLIKAGLLVLTGITTSLLISNHIK